MDSYTEIDRWRDTEIDGSMDGWIDGLIHGSMD